MPSRDGTYRIVDEPVRSSVEKWATNPLWPFLASIFAGTWLAWPWFAFNAFALGSSRRYGDVGLVVLGLVSNAVILVLLSYFLETKVLDEESFRYALLAPQAVRLVVLYVLFMRQSRTFELFTHFGGVGKNAAIVLVFGFFLRQRVLDAVPGLWALLLV